jgi:hypothetical protein
MPKGKKEVYASPVSTGPRVCRCDRPLASSDGECSKCGRPVADARAVLPFPVVKFDERDGRPEFVRPPREYKTIRRPETFAA